MGALKLEGMKFERLLVLEGNSVQKGKSRKMFWTCLCDCGNISVVDGYQLKSGTTKSCGCLGKENLLKANTKHDMSSTKVYNAWNAMKARCSNPNYEFYGNYGSRGITVHESFRDDFEVFYAEIGDPPDESLGWSVDRIDNNRGYEPGNIKWASSREQARNRRKYSVNKASWVDENGKRIVKYFSIFKLGEDGAFKAACQCRKEGICAVNERGGGYSENHGK